jgi:hypothetical protein
MIIVNFSTQHYLNGQKRLSKSLNGHKQLMLNSYEAIGSPTHSESPYEFKLNAIKAAWKLDPIVLWCDSSLWLVGDISVIENIIIQDGFMGTECGHYAGRWTNQHTRDYFKATEEEMTQGPGGITLFSAGFLGLNKENPLAVKFFDEWVESAKAGCFVGDWQNHRHDQSCASIIATRLGFKYQRGGKYLSYIGSGYSTPEASSVFYLQGIL